MFKVTRLSILALALTGCASIQMQNAANKIQDEMNKSCHPKLAFSGVEAIAWSEYKEAFKECLQPQNENILTVDEANKAIECKKDSFNSKYLPHAFSKKDAESHLSELISYLQSYAKGDISWEMLDAKASELNNSYTEKSRAEGNGSFHDWSQCRSNAMLANMPNSYSAMPALYKHLAEVNTMAIKADKEKLSLDEFHSKVDSLYAKFGAEESITLQAKRAQKAEAWRRAAQQWSAAQQRTYQENQLQMNSCNSLSIAPIPKIGCRKVCINGQWADVC